MRLHPRLRPAAAPLLAALLLGPLASAAGAPPPPRPGPLLFPARPKPVTPKGMPVPTAYKAGTPERALAEFLSAWHAKDYKRAAQFTGLRWKHLNPASLKTLTSVLGKVPLVSAHIDGVTAPDPSLSDAGPTVQYRDLTFCFGKPNARHTRAEVVTLYREIPPDEQSIKGAWRVGPEFAYDLPDYE